ncbi:MAG: hypothetical protein M1269_03875 [Chloroflexi bacterium]|nr:hypothetical protein [Chloroflexota bacterium]
MTDYIYIAFICIAPIVIFLIRRRLSKEKRVSFDVTAGLTIMSFAIILAYWGSPPVTSFLYPYNFLIILIALFAGTSFLYNGISIIWREIQDIKNHLTQSEKSKIDPEVRKG